MSQCTWEKKGGRYICQARQCEHWRESGCEIGKVSLTCDNEECGWNSNGHCTSMDVHLDADGKCLGVQVIE